MKLLRVTGGCWLYVDQRKKKKKEKNNLLISVNKRLDPFESNSHIVPLMRDRSIMQVQNAQTEGLLDIQTDPNLS